MLLQYSLQRQKTALCRDCEPLLRCVCGFVAACVCLLRKDMLSPLSSRLSKHPLTLTLSLSSRGASHKIPSHQSVLGGHILFIIISLSDSKEQQLCDCWGKEMLNNWEIKCLKRLYCNEPPPANFISYSALCLLFSPSPAIALAQLCTSSSPLTTPDYKIKSALNPVNTTFRLRERYSAMALHQQLYGN